MRISIGRFYMSYKKKCPAFDTIKEIVLMKTLVSVIVTTRNEEANIRACLSSIQKQSYQFIELIVVDNASSDGTKNIAEELDALVYDRGPERSAQRNFGAKKAKGDYLLFVDADMILSPNIVLECVKTVLTNKYTAVIIPERSVGAGFWSDCKALERSFYEGVEWIEAARFYRKDIFIKLGGYDEELTGPEDYDLPQRLKERYGKDSIGRIASYIFHNEGRLSLIKTLSKKYYYGKRVPQYLKKKSNAQYGRRQGSIHSRFGLFFSQPRLLFTNPFVGIGMLFMKSCEMGVLGIGYLVGRITL